MSRTLVLAALAGCSSTSMPMQGDDVDAASADGQVVVSIARRLHGKCDRTVVNFVGQLSNPGAPVAFTQHAGPKYGLPRFGTGVIAGNTYTMKVKRPSFSGIPVGCVYVALLTSGAAPTLIDDAPIVAFH